MNVFDELTNNFSRLPGIGKKSAVRMVNWLLTQDELYVQRFAKNIAELQNRIKPCSVCGVWTETDPCPICSNPLRELSQICVVEQSQDVSTIEAYGEYRGLYHVLGGVIRPLEGVGPAQLSIQPLLNLICGKDIVVGAVSNLFHGEFLDEAFLMTVSSIGAIVLGEYAEATAIMILYQIGEKFEDYAVEKSRNAIGEIAKLRPDKALVKNDGGTVEVPADEVTIGSIILVKAGDRVPIDGVIVDGESFIDTSALTGESVPRKVKAGDEILSGSINKQYIFDKKRAAR